MRGEIGVMCGEYAVVFARVPSTRELRTPEPGPCVVELYQLLSGSRQYVKQPPAVHMLKLK
jgi:hypothetical protein